MWALQNDTPYAAERGWIRDRRGAHQWVIAIKATYLIAADGITLAEQQTLPLRAAEHWGDPATTSVRYETDIGPMKPTTDILVNASAYAPGGKPRRSVIVALRVGSLRKELVVHGERIYQRGLAGIAPSEAQPFVSQPIRYEFAFGGTDTHAEDRRHHGHHPGNPLGCGFVVARSRLIGQRAPSIEYLDDRGGKLTPAGFGAIASHWSPRRELAGTYDERWAASRRPLLPEDYDERFTLCAPDDQQSNGYLQGGELVELENLDASGLLRFDLPAPHFMLSTSFGARREQHIARLATILVEPDHMRLSMTWQSCVAVPALEVAYLDVTRIQELRGAP
mgnify:CR=1 FL=1